MTSSLYSNESSKIPEDKEPYFLNESRLEGTPSEYTSYTVELICNTCNSFDQYDGTLKSLLKAFDECSKGLIRCAYKGCKEHYVPIRQR